MSDGLDALDATTRSLIDELREIVAADGARLVPSSVAPDHIAFDLVLDGASCAECVMPRALLEEIVNTRLVEVADDPPVVTIADPREADQL